MRDDALASLPLRLRSLLPMFSDSRESTSETVGELRAATEVLRSSSAAQGVELCQNCGRFRIGVYDWVRKKEDAAVDPRCDKRTGLMRQTLCRDCLAFLFPEYFGN